jgi:hypothetical protein
MIRSFLLIKLKPGTSDGQVEAFLTGLAAVPFAGRRNAYSGRDLGLRDDAMDLVIVADFDDERTYQAWVVDAEHGKVRQELLAPIAERVERSQIRI